MNKTNKHIFKHDSSESITSQRARSRSPITTTHETANFQRNPELWHVRIYAKGTFKIEPRTMQRYVNFTSGPLQGA